VTRLICRAVLIASGCASMWAQTAPLMPSPVVPKPFQFDGSQYKGLLPGWPVVLKPQGPLIIANRLVPGNKPCAIARITKPNPAIDPQMIPHNPGSTPMPIEAHSRDITEMNVPAPSCVDIAASQTPIRRTIPAPPPDPRPAR
jgi:hypothetical protein